MGLSDIAKGALLLIGTGILAERFGAGAGLSGLGAGISSIVAAPGVGIGAGLTGTATGIRSIGESFGDIGRGIASIFAALPQAQAPIEPQITAPSLWDPLNISGLLNLIPTSGGSGSTLAAGGGANTPASPTVLTGVGVGTGTGPMVTVTPDVQLDPVKIRNGGGGNNLR